MGGGLIQLAALGAQDVYITGDPDITFFKVVYKRHTNFARENIQIQCEKPFANGEKVTFEISRNADMIGAMFLHFTTTEAPPTAGRNWDTYIDYVDILIGGKLIDRHYGKWLDIWHDLTVPDEKTGGPYLTFTDSGTPTATTLSTSSGTYEMMGNKGPSNTASPYDVFIPFQFWFNKNAGCALPLISLQYNPVTIEVNFKAHDTGVNTLGGTTTADEYILVDYFYLDQQERTLLSKKGSEYLIEQVQYNGGDEPLNPVANAQCTMKMKFNHPVKEIIWQCFKINGDKITKTGDAHMMLNGTKLTNPHPSMNFNVIEPYKFHTRVPARGDIFLHSFALRPEEYQPSGTCNFSRIDNANLFIVADAAIKTVDIWAVNYNVLRIQSGMGALAFT